MDLPCLRRSERGPASDGEIRVQDRDTAIVHVIEELDISTRDIFAQSTQAAVAAGARSLILNLSSVTFVNSSGISALIDSRSIAQVMRRNPPRSWYD